MPIVSDGDMTVFRLLRPGLFLFIALEMHTSSDVSLSYFDRIKRSWYMLKPLPFPAPLLFED